VVENFFKYAGKEYHEVALYFLMRFPDASEIVRQRRLFYGNEEGMRLTFQWFPREAEALSKLPLLPSFLQSALQTLPESTQHVVHYDY
jgi:hypothetical protein